MCRIPPHKMAVDRASLRTLQAQMRLDHATSQDEGRQVETRQVARSGRRTKYGVLRSSTMVLPAF
jgi:hypothetical protein